MQELVHAVRRWGVEKGLIGPNGKATVSGQIDKLEEEFEEFCCAYHLEEGLEQVDAIGDMAVVLILMAELIGTPFEDCLAMAYRQIKNRTGRMVDGVFVKDAK